MTTAPQRQFSLLVFLGGILPQSGCGTPVPKADFKWANAGTPPGLSLGVATVPNLRDLGGYKTRGRRVVANGLVYRANQLCGISPEDIEKISALKLKNAYDLRTTEERNKRPDDLPPDRQSRRWS